MTRYALIAALCACLGLGAWAWWLQSRNAALSADLAQSEADRAAQADVSSILGHSLVQTRARAAEFSALFEELSNVKDDDSCRSPSIGAAVDILRARRAAH